MACLLLLLLPGLGEKPQDLQVAAQEDTQMTYRSLAITRATVSPDPIVGQTATLSIEVISPRDEKDVSIDVLLPEEIRLAAGELSWHGSLSANQPQIHEISIIVLQEGDWRIYLGVSSQLSETSSIGDGDTLNITSMIDSAKVVPSAEYRITESKYSDIWPYRDGHGGHIPDIFHLVPGGEETLATAGMVTIEGTLTYDALEADCFNVATCLTPILNEPLGGAIVELWDQFPGPTLLATGLSDDTGFYSITVLNEDPDGSGTGIDPVLLIYPEDGRIHVVDSLDFPYYELTPNIGQDVADGVIPFDHHIIQSDISQAMYIFEKLHMAYEFLQDEVAWNNNDSVEVNYPSLCVGLFDNSCYFGQIYLSQDQGRQPDAIIHEYGHFVVSRYFDNSAIIDACLYELYDHNLLGPSNETCAWSEGGANFFQMAVQSAYDPLYVPGYNDYDFETPVAPDLAVDPPPYYIWEATVTSILWDIFDGPSTVEPYYSFDTIQDGFNNYNNGIWQNSITELPNTLNDFYSAWNENRDYSCTISAIYQHHGLAYPPFRYTLTHAVFPNYVAGNISATPAPDCPENTYTGGTEVTLVANPTSPYAFYSWSIDGHTSLDDGNAIALTMDSDRVVSANFSVPDFEQYVMQSSDDAGPNPLSGDSCPGYWIGDPEIYIGNCLDGSLMVSGFRFLDVTIPDNADITAARLQFTVDGPFTNIVNAQFQVELSDDPVTFSDTNRPSDRSPLTITTVPWLIEDKWDPWTYRSSPNLDSVIQEVTDQPGWASGNAIVIIVPSSGSGTTSRRVFSWDREGMLRSARLQIWYTETPPPTPPPAPTNLKAIYDDGMPGPGLTVPVPKAPIPVPHVGLSWKPMLPEAGITYNVYRHTTSPVPVDAAHRIATGLDKGTYDDYDGAVGDYYVVTAVNNNVESDPSNTARAR